MRLSLAPLSDFDVAAIAAALVAFAVWRFRALTAGGAPAAWFVGTATFGALGWPGAVVLFAFFIPSIALSKYGKERKRPAFADVAKAGTRDAAQVLANGGVAAVCALLALAVDHRFAAAFAGAFAAATADTWGTEIGSLASGRPASIFTRKPIATGLSGGVTILGSAAEIAGALWIAIVAMLCGFPWFSAIAFAGIAGAFADSALGATVQALRWCPQCNLFCESEPHRCGANTRLVRGIAWFGNDAVNLAATLCGALVAFAFAR